MWDKEQNSSRVKLNPYLNHRWFGSPGLLDSSEATHLNLLPLPAPCFDSPCFLLLIRSHLKLFAPLKNKSAPICGFISIQGILCSSLSSLFPWLLVACSLTGARRGGEALREFLGEWESANGRGGWIPHPSHCNQLHDAKQRLCRDWEWLPEQGRFTSQPLRNSALKLLCKIL